MNKPLWYFNTITEAVWNVLYQGIIEPAGTKTFAKELDIAKLLRKLKMMPVLYDRKGTLGFILSL